MRFLLACCLLSLLPASYARAEPQEIRPGEWQVASLRYTRNASPIASGYIAWVQTHDGRGAAFRCDKRILYVFVAVEPFDFDVNMLRLGFTGKNWKVLAKVGDFPEREEKWVSVHGGAILMARRISTTNRLFRGARGGITVRITERRDGVSTVDIPADSYSVLDRFEELCELRQEFAPSAEI